MIRKISAREIVDNIEAIESTIRKACEGGYDLDEVIGRMFSQLLTGEADCYIVETEGELIATLIVEYLGKYANVIICAGRGLKDWLLDFDNMIVDEAKRRGLFGVQYTGRMAGVKVLKPLGYQHNWTTYVKVFEGKSHGLGSSHPDSSIGHRERRGR